MEMGYGISQTAELLGIKVRTARNWIASGIIHAKKICGTNRWIVMESEINRLRGTLEDADKDSEHTAGTAETE